MTVDHPFRGDAGVVRRKARCGNVVYGGASCVEVGQARDGMILVRDTKNRGRGPVHRYTPEEWRAFITGVRNGGLDGSGRLP
jgi:hypothetical protein